jgi:hypothetical protein
MDKLLFAKLVEIEEGAEFIEMIEHAVLSKENYIIIDSEGRIHGTSFFSDGEKKRINGTIGTFDTKETIEKLQEEEFMRGFKTLDSLDDLS